MYGGISSYLHKKRQKTLHKALLALEKKVKVQPIKIIHLEDLMVMYSIYNWETLEKLISIVHKMHNTTIPNEKPFAGKLNSWDT